MKLPLDLVLRLRPEVDFLSPPTDPPMQNSTVDKKKQATDAQVKPYA